MDERDWTTLGEILFDDATADFGTGLLRGRQAIIEVIQSYLLACGATQHFIGSVLIDVDGKAATSRAYVRDVHIGNEERAHLEFSTLGDYHDRRERSDDSWRIRHRLKHNRANLGTLEVFRMDQR
jgi:hypothetical protein